MVGVVVDVAAGGRGRPTSAGLIDGRSGEDLHRHRPTTHVEANSFKLIILSLIAMHLGARPAARVSIARLADQAQAIVVASVLDGQQGGQHVTFRLQIARTVKGNASPGDLIPVDWQSTEVVAGIRMLPKAQGLWFLTAGSLLPLDLHADFGDAFLPMKTAPLPPTYQYDPSTAVVDKILLEIGAALEFADRYTKGRLFMVFDGLPKGIGRISLGRLATSSSSEVQAAALSGLLRNGDKSALQQVVRNYDLLVRASNIVQVKDSIAFHFRDIQPDAVQLLAELVRRDGELKLAAAEALRAIHTRQTLPILAQLLDSPVPELQTSAVAGLSSFVMSLPVETPESLPTMSFLRPAGPSPLRTKDVEPYLSIDRRLPAGRQSQLVQFWKGWWKANGASLVAP